MRLARLLTETGPVSGRYENGHIVASDGRYEVGRDGRLLPPCNPRTLYCIGRNFATTVDQMSYERPEEPKFFIKPPTSLLAHEQPIRYPKWTDELSYAGELVAVIDRRCHDVDPDEVAEIIRGYTIMNDVDALDQHGITARKAFNGSAPLGPWIETDIDPTSVDIRTTVSGETKQDASTEQMLFKPAEIVSYLSRRFTFYPGDCIAFGGPGEPELLDPGDRVEITYEGVGTLANDVIE